MAALEIRYLSGDVETYELSKKEPISIGKHASNDIRVHDDDVAVMHCRISWNKREYEVVAANVEGVELNGTFIRQAPLRPGDVLRIGSVDISLQTDGASADGGQAPQQDGSVSNAELKPITEDAIPLSEQTARPVKDRSSGKSSPKRSQRDRKPNPKPAVPDDFDDEDQQMKLPDDIFEDDDDDDDEDIFADAKKIEPQKDIFGDEADDEAVAAQPMIHRRTSFAKSEEGEESAEPDEQPEQRTGASLVGMLREKIGAGPVRPGEQDIMRSPLVISLGATALILTLLSFIYWFMITRETEKRQYEAAVDEMNQGKYTQAIKLFEDYLMKYPRDEYTDLARFGRGESRIEQETSSSTPNWPRAMERLQEYIRELQDLPTFSEQSDKLRKYSREIAKGAAKQAERGAQQAKNATDLKTQVALLEHSRNAEKILVRFSPKDSTSLKKTQKGIQTGRDKATAAIRKRAKFHREIAAIEKAIKQNDTTAALKARLRLLETYPDFRTNETLAKLLEKTLKTERALVAAEELNRQAVGEDRVSAFPRPLSLTLNTRSRTDEVSDNRTVFVLGKDCCYGIDQITGYPVWRRAIGFDTPFFPVEVTTSTDGLLVFDTNYKELVFLDRRTGKLVWRQPLGEDVAGPPLVYEGQIYLPTLANHLYKIGLDTGRVTAKLTFSQKVLAPPVLVSDGKRMVVAGDVAVMYTLSLRPLACQAVSDFGHQPGAIQAPLVKMGRLILVAENEGLNSARLCALQADDKTNRLSRIAEIKVPGQVRDRPILRGKALFVPFGREQVAAFTVSDDKDQRPLTRLATRQLQDPLAGPMYLSVGPDGQLWMASSRLRKLQLKTDNSITIDPAETAVGLSTQPLQAIGQKLYIGRRLPYSDATLFTQADRQQMISHWRTIVGSRILAMMVSSQGDGVVVTEAGSLIRFTGNELKQGGFKHNAVDELKLPEGLTAPLRATPLGAERIAVYCGAPEPRLWIINRLGQIERQEKLEQPLEADPVVLANGLVLPMPGKLRFLGPRSSGTRVEDYVPTVSKQQPAKWIHLAVVDQDQLIVLDSQARLVRVQLRQKGKAHLAEAQKLELESPVDVKFPVHNKKIYLADTERRLRIVDASNLETLSQAQLDGPASNDLWLVGEKLYVETGRSQLHCYEIVPELKRLWSIPIGDSSLAGPPLISGNRLIVAKQNGEILTIDPTSGEQTGNAKKVGQPLNLGIQQMGEFLVVTSLDGSLHRIETKPKTPAGAGNE